jgi:ATP-dependent Lon protease
VVRSYLKKERFESELSEIIEIPGIATGLAVTPVGGDILFVEATLMNGKGRLTLTGQLGYAMKESAQIAHSYVRSKIKSLHLDLSIFRTADIKTTRACGRDSQGRSLCGAGHSHGRYQPLQRPACP